MNNIKIKYYSMMQAKISRKSHTFPKLYNLIIILKYLLLKLPVFRQHDNNREYFYGNINRIL